jgi:predicted nuclease of predicted toxin-antitoxin system
MRFKVDENLPPDTKALLEELGHDVLTVWDQQIRGAKDPRLAEVCRAEQRILLTFDLSFGDIR